MEKKVIIANANQTRHGQRVITKGAPYEVVGENQNKWQVATRCGLHVFIDKNNASSVEVITFNKK